MPRNVQDDRLFTCAVPPDSSRVFTTVPGINGNHQVTGCRGSCSLYLDWPGSLGSGLGGGLVDTLVTRPIGVLDIYHQPVPILLIGFQTIRLLFGGFF